MNWYILIIIRDCDEVTCKVKALTNRALRHRANENPGGIVGFGNERSSSHRVTIVFDSDGVTAHLTWGEFGCKSTVHRTSHLEKKDSIFEKFQLVSFSAILSLFDKIFESNLTLRHLEHSTHIWKIKN